MKKKVSVVIPYKDESVARQMKDCVKSLLIQSVPPFEIIVVGAKNLKLGRFVKYIRSLGDKNQARNIGIVHSRGDYILYLDHDMVAEPDLIEDCLSLTRDFDAIIIPERGLGGNFWQNCQKLEKELIKYDIHTVTPRFYRRLLFKKNELPFDDRFGLLDEWGFNHKLQKIKAGIGYSRSFLKVKQNNVTLKNEIKNKFSRGYWMKNFYAIDKNEAWIRINPLERGVIFYGRRFYYLFKEPIYFPGLILLKTIDFIAFMTGYVYGLLKKK